jgi:hypothetical protein
MTHHEKQQWEKERAKGLGRYILRRGLLFYGLFFAVGMTLWQISDRLTLEKYLINFIINAVGFGGFMGFFTWGLNEYDYQQPTEEE